jgi:hypothetical protein
MVQITFIQRAWDREEKCWCGACECRRLLRIIFSFAAFHCFSWRICGLCNSFVYLKWERETVNPQYRVWKWRIAISYSNRDVHTLLQELTEYYTSHIGWRRTKQSWWWEISSTFARDIFNFFQQFRWKFSTGSKFSDYIPFTQDGNHRRFEVFRLYSLYTGWKFSTGSNFPIIFPLHRMEILDV